MRQTCDNPCRCQDCRMKQGFVPYWSCKLTLPVCSRASAFVIPLSFLFTFNLSCSSLASVPLDMFFCVKWLLPLHHVPLVKLCAWYFWMCDDLNFIRTRHLLVRNGMHAPFVLHNLFHAFVRARMLAFQTFISLASITSAAASAAVFRAAGLYLRLPTCIAVEILGIPLALFAAI